MSSVLQSSDCLAVIVLKGKADVSRGSHKKCMTNDRFVIGTLIQPSSAHSVNIGMPSLHSEQPFFFSPGIYSSIADEKDEVKCVRKLRGNEMCLYSQL